MIRYLLHCGETVGFACMLQRLQNRLEHKLNCSLEQGSNVAMQLLSCRTVCSQKQRARKEKLLVSAKKRKACHRSSLEVSDLGTTLQ